MSPSRAALPQHSPDGSWWWSGTEWLPAWSADRRWWFNGVRWKRRSPAFPRPSTVEYVMFGVWFVVWVLALVFTSFAVPAYDSGVDLSDSVVRSGLALAVGSAGGLLVCGYLLGRTGRWVYLAALTLYVWVLMLALYVGAMSMVPESAGGYDDNAAGAGFVLLGGPALFVTATLVGLGAGVGAAVRFVARRPTR